MVEKKRVLLLSTGGTLTMLPLGDGQLEPNVTLPDLDKWLPELGQMAHITLERLSNIDSAHMNPELWLQLATRINQAMRQDECDGIVILHGTDTMAFTAAALSFLLPHLSLPVVLTGSQRPLSIPRTDARNNILGAVEVSLNGPVEIMVFFHHRMFRGNRVSKIAIHDFNGFASANLAPLGHAGISLKWNKPLFWPKSRRPTIWQSLPRVLPQPPLVVPWLPGMSLDVLGPIFEHNWAVILEGFGSGNLPIIPGFGEILRQFRERDGLVFVRSQAAKGSTDMKRYQSGRALLELGVQPCNDMTREASVTKLMVLKALGFSIEDVRHQMSRNWVGELSETNTRDDLVNYHYF